MFGTTPSSARSTSAGCRSSGDLSRWVCSLLRYSLFSGWQRVELLQHGYRLEQMQKARGDEEEINRHLRLEIETLKSPQRIETLATGRLKLVVPETGSAIVIERVVPPDPPPASVVATALE